MLMPDIRPRVALRLGSPPEVVSLGRGVHGRDRDHDRFRLPELWSLHLYDYRADMRVEGHRFEIRPGTMTLVPPDSLIDYFYDGPSNHWYVHLREADADGDVTELPMYVDVGGEQAAMHDLLRSAVVSAAATGRPGPRARADVWTVLLRLGDVWSRRTRDYDGRREDLIVGAAMSWMEAHLAEPITIAQVAAAVGVSRSHLARQFRAVRGSTVVGYLRQRRVERARLLLVGTTLPIGTIAATCGFADLQALNKTCRAVLGVPPRRIRAGS